METIKMSGRLSNEERETVLVFDNIDKVWTMDSSVPKHFRKALKQGWTPIKEFVYDDGTVCGMMLTAPERAITIRSVEKKQVSEKQLKILNKDDK